MSDKASAGLREVSGLFVAELAPLYQARPALVVDCSVVAAIIFAESIGHIAAQQLAGKNLHAPFLLDFEVVSVARKKSAPETSAVIAAAMDFYATLALERHPVDPKDLFALASRYQISAYDAAYLLVASELRAPLATFDRKLGVVAQKHLASLC